MNVSFTPQARDDLFAIRDWIARDDAAAADRLVSRIRQTAMMLSHFPALGRPGGIPDTREFTVTGLPYLIVYRLASETDLDILTIVHSRRMFPGTP